MRQSRQFADFNKIFCILSTVPKGSRHDPKFRFLYEKRPNVLSWDAQLAAPTVAAIPRTAPDIGGVTDLRHAAQLDPAWRITPPRHQDAPAKRAPRRHAGGVPAIARQCRAPLVRAGRM
jgi:hypothetical protein